MFSVGPTRSSSGVRWKWAFVEPLPARDLFGEHAIGDPLDWGAVVGPRRALRLQARELAAEERNEGTERQGHRCRSAGQVVAGAGGAEGEEDVAEPQRRPAPDLREHGGERRTHALGKPVV